MNTIHWAMRELWQSSVRVPIAHPAVKIIDVGCGSGIWAKELAEVLPRAHVMGVDLSPTILQDEPGRPVPNNLSFEVFDPVDLELTYLRLMISILAFNTPRQASILSMVVSLLVESPIGSVPLGRCFAFLLPWDTDGFNLLRSVLDSVVTTIHSRRLLLVRPGLISSLLKEILAIPSELPSSMKSRPC